MVHASKPQRFLQPGVPIAQACTIQTPDGQFCEAPTNHLIPYPICGHHAAMIYRSVRDALTDDDHATTLSQALADVPSLDKRITGALVYYIAEAGLIKIGYTANLRQRLRCYGPTARVLATEPGDRDLERERRTQFRVCRATRYEWFRPDPMLMQHIESVAQLQSA